jgi:hypothetical protein
VNGQHDDVCLGSEPSQSLSTNGNKVAVAYEVGSTMIVDVLGYCRVAQRRTFARAKSGDSSSQSIFLVTILIRTNSTLKTFTTSNTHQNQLFLIS